MVTTVLVLEQVANGADDNRFESGMIWHVQIMYFVYSLPSLPPRT